MKYLPFLIVPFFSFSQVNTEVFIFDYTRTQKGFEVTNFINISNNKGYDNQPSFYLDDFILYSGNNNGQTDVFKYDFSTKKSTQVNTLTSGSEYSPQGLPNEYDVAAVRLDTNGVQRLYKYDVKTGLSTRLFKELQVAYYAFYNTDTIVSAVLHNDYLDLVVSSLSKQTHDTLTSYVGRSIHKVPFSNNMSYTVLNEDKNHDLYILDVKSLESYFVCELPIGVEDYTWLDGDSILIGSNASLFVYDLYIQKWEKRANLSRYKIVNITRLAVNFNLKKIALVAEIKE